MLESTSTSTEDSHIFSDKEDHVLSDWLAKEASVENVKNVERKLEEWRVELEREFENKRNARSERQVSIHIDTHHHHHINFSNPTQNELLASIMEKQTESVERIAEKIQWIDEETARHVEEDRNEFEIQAREIDKRLKILEAYEPVEYRLQRLEDTMHKYFMTTEEDVSVEKEEEEEIEHATSVHEATNILRNLHKQVENSVNMLQSYLERAEAMTKDVKNPKNNENSEQRYKKMIREIEMRHAIDNRRLAGRYRGLERRIQDIESAVMEEQQSSLESLRVLLRTIRKTS